MNSIYILCVDDERDVLEAVERDLRELENAFPIELAESAEEARRALERIHAGQDAAGLIFCDHLMPGENGVDLLISLRNQPETRLTRKVLLTGQAGLRDTIDAVNRANLNHYIAKPWETGELIRVAKEQLTDYVIAAGADPLPYLATLDAERLSEQLRRGNLADEG